MSIFTGLLTKLAGSAVGTWFSGNLVTIVVVAFVALGGLTGWYKYTSVRNAGRADLAEERYNNVRGDYDALLITVDIKEAAFAHCEQVNKDNAERLVVEKQKVQDGLTAIKLLQAESVHTVKDIHDDAEKLRDVDKECRTVDQPLPDFFTVGLYQ